MPPDAPTDGLNAELDAIEYYFEQGVTDGLPVVPPTEERMQLMLAATSRAADEVVALVPPNFGEASIEKIAVNAVMAGCTPAFLPVVIAGVRAMCDERANLHGVQGTTHTAHAAVYYQRPDTPAARYQLCGRRVWFGLAGQCRPSAGRCV